MQLFILIIDNFGLDSNYIVMNLFVYVDLLLEQYQYVVVFEKFDFIIVFFLVYGLVDEILYCKGLVMEVQGKWEDVFGYFEKIEKFYYDDIFGDDVVFCMGDIYQNYLNVFDKVVEEYKKILFEYKGSLFIVEVCKRYCNLCGDKIIEELEL